jgi:hypothetical protein
MGDNSNKNNGLITKIWGPAMWTALHSISFGYPIKPTDEQKKDFMNFFILVGDILPCKYCRDSYKKFIASGCAKLTYNVMTNRESFTRWLYLLHNAVNNKLGVNYGVSYDDIVIKYESYRAKCSKSKTGIKLTGCIMPLNMKSKSYENAETKDYPIISSDVVSQCIDYAKKRNIDQKYINFAKLISNQKEYTKMFENKHNNSIWKKRNQNCNKIITNMRKNRIKSLEKSGEWEGYPTLDELKLILLGSTNLSNDQLNNVVNKISKSIPHGKQIKKRRFILIK